MDKYLPWAIGIVFGAGGFYMLVIQMWHRLNKHSTALNENQKTLGGHETRITVVEKSIGNIEKGIDDLKQTQRFEMQEIKELIRNGGRT